MPSDRLAMLQPGAMPPAPQVKEPDQNDIDQAMAKHRGHPEEVIHLLEQADGKNRSRIQSSVQRVLPKEDQDAIKKGFKGGGGSAPAHKDAPKGGAEAQKGEAGKGKDGKGEKDEGKDGKKGKSAREVGGGGGAGGGGAPSGEPIAEANATAARFNPADRQEVEDQVAQHQAWAAVGDPGSWARLKLAAEAAGAGLAKGGATGFVAGVAGGLLGEAMKKVPLAGAILAGGLSAYALITGWSQTTSAIRQGWHNPFESWRAAAETMEGLSALLGLVSNVLNVLAGVAAAAAALGLVLTIIGVGGFVLPWAVPFATYAMTAASLLGKVNSLLVQPAATAFRFMDVMTAKGDPESIEKEAEKLKESAEKVGASLGGFAGGKAAKGIAESKALKGSFESASDWMANKFPPLAGRATPLPASAGSGGRATPSAAGSSGRATPAAAGSGGRAAPARQPSAPPSQAAAPSPQASAPVAAAPVHEPTTPGLGGPTPARSQPPEGSLNHSDSLPSRAPTRPGLGPAAPTRPATQATPAARTEIDYRSRPGRVARRTLDDADVAPERASGIRMGATDREREGATRFYEGSDQLEREAGPNISVSVRGHRLDLFKRGALEARAEKSWDKLIDKAAEAGAERMFGEGHEAGHAEGGREPGESGGGGGGGWGDEREAGASSSAQQPARSQKELPPPLPPPFASKEVTDLAGQAYSVAVERKKLMETVHEASKVQADSVQRQPNIAKMKAATDEFKSASMGHKTELVTKQTSLDAAKAKHGEYKGNLAQHKDSLSGGPVGTILGVTRTMESMVRHLNRILDVSSTLQNVTAFRKNLEKGQQALTGEGPESAKRDKEHDKVAQGIKSAQTAAAANQAKFTQHGATIAKLDADDKAGSAMAKQAESHGLTQGEQLKQKQKQLEEQFDAKRTQLTQWAQNHREAMEARRKAGKE